MNVEDVSDEGSGMSQEHYRHIPRRRRGSLNWNECTVNRNLDFKNTAGGDPWVMRCMSFLLVKGELFLHG